MKLQEKADNICAHNIQAYYGKNIRIEFFCICRERGQWAVFYTRPQSFILTLSYLLALQHRGLEFDLLVHYVKSPNALTTSLIYQKG